MWEKLLCRHKDQWRRRGRRGSSCWRRDSPAGHEDHGETGCSPAMYGGQQWSRYPPETCGRPHTRPGGCPKEAVNPRKAHTGTGSCQDLWTSWRQVPTLEQAGLVTLWDIHARAACSWRTAHCGKEPCWSNSWRTAASGKDSCWSSSWRTVSHGSVPALEQGKRARKQKWQRQLVKSWPQSPFSIPLHLCGGRGREFGSEIKPGKEGGVRGKCFKIWFYFSFS